MEGYIRDAKRKKEKKNSQKIEPQQKYRTGTVYNIK